MAPSGRASSSRMEKWSCPSSGRYRPGRPARRHAAAYSSDCRISSGSSPRPTVTIRGADRDGKCSAGLLRAASAGSRPSLSLR